MILEPIPVKSKMKAPIKIAITEVSPTDPGTIPIKELYKLYTPSDENKPSNTLWFIEESSFDNEANSPNAVSPETPSKRNLLVWLPANEWPESRREELLEALLPLAKTFGLDDLIFNWVKVEDEDWNLTWKKHWKPDPVGEKFLILPSLKLIYEK